MRATANANEKGGTVVDRPTGEKTTVVGGPAQTGGTTMIYEYRISVVRQQFVGEGETPEQAEESALRQAEEYGVGFDSRYSFRLTGPGGEEIATGDGVW